MNGLTTEEKMNQKLKSTLLHVEHINHVCDLVENAMYPKPEPLQVKKKRTTDQIGQELALGIIDLCKTTCSPGFELRDIAQLAEEYMKARLSE